MAIVTSMTGAQIDRALKAILTVMGDENADGKVLYIRNGELAYADGTELFDVSVLEDE